MEAVKKAYAGIILNMAKEAAARVMAAEKKALKFQQDLHSTKEEALRMLLRLKLIIDAKTTEAESLSQNQQRRIDELEAQLNEAEGLIIDLRAELHDVHEQLNEAKNKPLHHLRAHAKEDLVCRNSIMAKSNVNNSESLKFPTELGSKVCKLADMSDTALCNYSKDNLNEPEIYKNGWCAIAMNLADERLHSGDDPSFPIKVTQVTEPSGRDGEAHIAPSSKAMKAENLVGEEQLKGHASMQRPYTFLGKRRRKARYGKTKNSFCKARCNKLVFSQRPLPAISRCSARYLHTDTLYDSPNSPSTNTERNNVAGSSFVSGKEGPQNKGLNIAVARRSIRKRRVKYLDVSYPPSLSHSSLSNQPMRPGLQFPSFPNSKSNAAEYTVKSTKLGGEGGIEEGTSFQAASLGFTVENMICRKFACADNDAHKDDTELIDVSVMVEEGDDQPLLNFGVLPVESILGDTKASEGSKESNLQGNNMTPLKYTFSRKRKKDNLLNPNENSSPDCSVKKKSVEIENIDPRLQDSEALKDSPLRSKHLVQVAHQKRKIEMVMVVKMEERKKEDKLQAVWFAAGVAALMACLERAILVSFVEQWRLIAFLALNLLLLAILFTSTSTTPTTPIVETSNNTTTTESKIEQKVGKESKKPLVPCVEDISEEAIIKDVKEEYPKITDKKENKEEQLLDDSIDEAQQISMEELNERAEAFIAMFRQHLISDAKAYSYSKSCRIRTSISLKGGDKNFPKRRPIY